MNRNRPRRFQRVLLKRSLHRLRDLPRLLVQRVSRVRPFLRGHLNLQTILFSYHLDGTVINSRDFTDFPVVVTLFR